MKTEIMIDLETLAVPEDLAPGALVEVVEIGVVRFLRDGTMPDLGMLFFPREGNGQCSAATARWWMNQPEPEWLRVRNEAESPETLPGMQMCLAMLTRYIADFKAVVWSKGAFDLRILAAHYAAQGMPCPWLYHQCRDLRTAMKEAGVMQPYETVAHSALEDARDQVRLLRECRARVMVVK